jgi:hypothetical protein
MGLAVMNIASLSPVYVPLIQKPTCCAVTCLQMILFRNQCGLFDQEELAITFGVKISAEDAAAFSTEMPIMTNANFDEGIQTVEAEERINAFFKTMAPELRATCFKSSNLHSLTDVFSTHLHANHDIWVEYHAQEIHSTDENRGNYIHDGLIESLDLTNGRVVVIDPMPKHRQRLVVSLATLERAISTQYGRETGFVVIEKR